MARFIVLRDKANVWQSRAMPIDAAITRGSVAGPAQPQIASVNLDHISLRDLIRDPECLAVAPVMPTRLVNPEPLDDLRAKDTVPGWGIHAVGADWTRTTGAGARIALLDTGIDKGHAAFKGVRLHIRDFVGSGIEDANGHGTHMAGTILGRDQGGTRIGVARGVQELWVAKAIADQGLGRSDQFLEAVLWSITEGVDVACFALSFDIAAHVAELEAEGYPTVQANVAAANAYRGNLRMFEFLLAMVDPAERPLFLGAVGNDSLRVISPEFETGPAAPAAAENVIAVGAVGPSEIGLMPAPFSNIGPGLVAPGVGIISASLGDGLRSLNGSSMATAHVAGVAALWIEEMRAQGQSIDTRALAARLTATCTRAALAPRQTTLDCGRGLVQGPRDQLD
jgi:subtilisin family serine protease